MNHHKYLIIAIIVILSSMTIDVCFSRSDQIGVQSLQTKTEMNLPIDDSGPQEEWNKTFGGDKLDYLIGIRQTVDEGFVCAGVKDADSWTEGGTCWLLKTDKYGSLLWEQTFGGDGANSAHDIQISSDQGYVIGGVTTSFGSGSRDVWIIKTDNNGYEEWNCTFNRRTMDMVYVSLTTVEDGHIICCDAYSDVSKDIDALVVKIDETGHQQWNATYGFDKGREFFTSVLSTIDRGYVFTGSTYNQLARRYDAWIVKTDAAGQMQWDKKFGPAYNARDIIQTSDGGYLLIVSAMINSQMENIAPWLIKLDKNGNEEWDKIIERPVGKNLGNLNKILQTPDENYLLIGTLGEFPLHFIADMWFMKVDKTGNILWELTKGGPDFDAIDYGEITLDGGFIVSGKTTRNNSMNWDARLIKMSSDQDENQPPDQPDKPSGITSGEINNAYSYSTTTNDTNGDQVYYLWDWGDGSDCGWLGPYNSGETCEAKHNWSAKNNYNIKVKAKDTNGVESDWSDPLSITMPCSYHPKSQVLLLLFQHLPHMFALIRQIFGV